MIRFLKIDFFFYFLGVESRSKMKDSTCGVGGLRIVKKSGGIFVFW